MSLRKEIAEIHNSMLNAVAAIPDDVEYPGIEAGRLEREATWAALLRIAETFDELG